MANSTAEKRETLSCAQDPRLEMLTNNLISTENSGSKLYHCNCCNSNFDAAVDHMNNPNHRFHLLQKLKKEFIVRNEDKLYYCLFCDTLFKGILDHVQSSGHLINRKLPNKISLIERNAINCSPTFYDCLYCQVELQTYQVIESHVSGKEHIKALTRKKLSDNLILEREQKTKTYCFCCDSFVNEVFNHIDSPSHNARLTDFLAKNFIVNNSFQKYYCLFCDYYFGSALEHVTDIVHLSKKRSPKVKSLISKNNLISRANSYFCNSCNVALSTLQTIIEHVREKKHFFKQKNDADMLKTLAENFIVTNDAKCLYYCFFCDCYCEKVLEHLDDQTHKINMKLPHKNSLITENGIISKPEFYYCTWCNAKASTFETTRGHLNGKKHTSNRSKHLSKLNSMSHLQSTTTVLENSYTEINAVIIEELKNLTLEENLSMNGLDHSESSVRDSNRQNSIEDVSEYFEINVQRLESHKNDAAIGYQLGKTANNSNLPNSDGIGGMEMSQDDHVTSEKEIFQTKIKLQALCDSTDGGSDGDEESTSSSILMDDYYSLVYAMEGSKPNVSRYLLQESRLDKQLLSQQCFEYERMEEKKTESSLKFDDAAAHLTVSSIPKMMKPLKKKKCRKRRVESEEKFPYNSDILSLNKDDAAKFLERGDDDIYSTVNLINQQQLQKGLDFIYSTATDEICLACECLFASEMQHLLEHLHLESHLENVEFLEDLKAVKEVEYKYYNLAKACMIEAEDKDALDCLACKVSIKDTDHDFQSHVKSLQHASKMKDWELRKNFLKSLVLDIIKEPWYFAQRFFCQLCLFTTKREVAFINHLGEREHIKNVNTSQEENKIKICYVCSTCWYGSLNYSQHFTDQVHKQSMRLGDGAMVPKMKHESILLLISLEQNVEKLVRESENVIRSQSRREATLLKAIEDTVKPKYPLAEAHIFGSRISGLCSAKSDVDVFLDCEGIYHEIGSKDKSQKYIRSVRKLFGQSKKRPNPWRNIIVFIDARVPLIRMQHLHTGLNCDVSFLSGLSIEKSKLIRNFVVSDVRCRKLILFLKQWFSACNLYGSRAFNCYAISWYVIFYLQIEGIFPSVDELKIKDESNYVDGWQCHFSERISVGKLKNKFRNLLKGFFLYYSKFDYQTSVACPLIGKVIKKSTFVNFDDLPAEMETYKNRMETEEMEIFRFDSPLCIQDPVDLTQNITKHVDKVQLRSFRSYCVESHAKL